MKKLYLLIMLLSIFMITGCSSSNSSNSKLYGYVKGNTYINEEFDFSMNVHKNWSVNEGIEKLNAKSISKDNINGEDFIVVNYNNSKKYITDYNDTVLVFETMYSNNSHKIIDEAIKSIQFNI
jgi:hypothetical protein